MRYLSPASLPESPPLSPPDKKAWAQLRKKLLTDLDLSVDGTLYIKDRPFTKNDILEYFDGLQDETILNYHAAVAKDEVLVHFLEDGQFPAEGSFSESAVYTYDFLVWISPWFYTAFVGCVTDCLQRANEDELRMLLDGRLLLTKYDLERAWIQIGNLLENDVEQLRQYLQQAQANKQQIPFSIEELYPYTDDGLIRMIRMFPEQPFAGVRNSYAAILMDLSIHIFNKQKESRPIAEKWLTHAKRLAVSTDLVAAITAKLAEMEKTRKTVSSGAVRAIIVILIVISQFVPRISSSDPPHLTKFTVINGKDTVVIDESNPRDSALNKKKIDSILKTAPRPD